MIRVTCGWWQVDEEDGMPWRLGGLAAFLAGAAGMAWALKRLVLR